jgi:hypothetical protein
MTRKSILSLALVLMVLIACKYLGKKPEYIHSDDDLQKEYMKSKSDFTAKYNGKEVVFWGIVGSINPLSDSARVRFQKSPGSDSSAPDIVCTVDKPDVKRFEELKVEVGTYVRVKGQMSVDDNSGDQLELKS